MSKPQKHFHSLQQPKDSQVGPKKSQENSQFDSQMKQNYFNLSPLQLN